jgi:hypothetical protein
MQQDWGEQFEKKTVIPMSTSISKKNKQDMTQRAHMLQHKQNDWDYRTISTQLVGLTLSVECEFMKQVLTGDQVTILTAS